MNYKKVIFPAFILLALVQIFVPASMILQHEDVLTTGTAYKFKTAPFDPYDPFRGKFIRLAYEEDRFENPVDTTWGYRENVYVSLTTDKEGFAKIKNVTRTIPANTSDYVEAEAYYYGYKEERNLTITYPFDRFYMEESKAFEAETAYRESRIDTSSIAYALVKVKDGVAVIENVFIDDVPIKEVVEASRKE